LISYSKSHAADESYHEQLQWHELGKAEWHTQLQSNWESKEP